jgi:hypothetical protein
MKEEPESPGTSSSGHVRQHGRRVRSWRGEGYRCIFTLPETISRKILAIKLFGAEVVLTPEPRRATKLLQGGSKGA